MKKMMAILLVFAAVTTASAIQEKKELTELQKAKAELIKLQIQIASKDQQLAQCRIQSLETPARALEVEFLKQVGAEPGAQWDWSTMTAKKP